MNLKALVFMTKESKNEINKRARAMHIMYMIVAIASNVYHQVTCSEKSKIREAFVAMGALHALLMLHFMIRGYSMLYTCSILP